MPTRRRLDTPDDFADSKLLLDVVNRRLIAVLTQNVRTSVSELARRVGMSAPAVRERIVRLEQRGVIRGYRLDIDPATIGLPVTAWVRIKPGPGQLARIAALAVRIPEISECYRISGDDCFLLKVHVRSIGALESILDQFLILGETTSSFVVSTPIPPRPPVVGGSGGSRARHGEDRTA